MKGSFGITFTEDKGIINIQYECGCRYNHFPDNLKSDNGIWCSTWTSLCKEHYNAIMSLLDIFDKLEEEKK